MTATLTYTNTNDTLLSAQLVYFWSVASSDIFVITFGNGRQVAISGYADLEAGDLAIGLAADGTVNLHMNEAAAGATFTVYAYDGASLGAPFYTFTATGADTDPGFRLSYDPDQDRLDIDFISDAPFIGINGEWDGSFSGASVFSAPVCFLRGTLILTDRGEVPVEELRAGDLVATRFGGMRRVAWIGTQSFDARFAGAQAAPIRFAPGSLGQGMPHSDLFVSPGHAILIQGAAGGDVLAHAGALVNVATITQPAPRGTIDYFHLDLDGHDCVLANGAWAESYFEDRNRHAFHNAATHQGGAPTRQPTCLPILTEGHPDLPAIRERLAPAEAIPHLLADGALLPLAETAPGTWQAIIPEGLARLRLRSPAFQPPGDARTLGLMVHALSLDGAPLAPEGEGWHAPEQGWTWTDGNAALPPRAGTLTLQGWHPAAEQRRAA